MQKDLHNRLIFSDIYSNAIWDPNGKDLYCSGDGSQLEYFTRPYVKSVTEFISKLENKPNALDLGCGNFLVGSQIRELFNEYYAIDVVPHVIEHNKIKYESLNVHFNALDAEIEELPMADVVMVRQVFQHLSNKSIDAILKKLKNYKYLIITEHVPSKEFIPNIDKPSGYGTRYSLSGVVIEHEPFNFTYKEKHTLCVIDAKHHGGLLITNVYTQ